MKTKIRGMFCLLALGASCMGMTATHQKENPSPPMCVSESPPCDIPLPTYRTIDLPRSTTTAAISAGGLTEYRLTAAPEAVLGVFIRDKPKAPTYRYGRLPEMTTGYVTLRAEGEDLLMRPGWAGASVNL